MSSKTKKLIGVVLVSAMMLPTILKRCGSSSTVGPTREYIWVDNDDMYNMRGRILDSMYDVDASCEKELAGFQEDGSFDFVDYTYYDTNQKHWKPIMHLEAILALQTAYFTEGNRNYGKAEVFVAIQKSMAFWVVSDFKCAWNGWYSSNGIPNYIKNICMFPNDNIDNTVYNGLMDDGQFSVRGIENVDHGNKQRPVGPTGGNLTETLLNHLYAAVITNDGSYLMWLVELMENELRPFPDSAWYEHSWDAEGIKSDNSFLQHFELLHFGGYGEVFCDNITVFINIIRDTQYCLKESSMIQYTDFILEGMQYAYRNGNKELLASGRGIARQNGTKGIYNSVKMAASALLEYDSDYRRGELEYILSDRTAGDDAGAGGHKYYYKADYQIMNNANYMASVRHASDRTRRYECLGPENLWGYYLGSGASMYYPIGDEYYDIYPLWDWNRVPGTTTRQGYLPDGRDVNNYVLYGTDSFVGGVSNGTIGMSAIDYDMNGVSARKSYFMFDEGVYHLGSDIHSNKKEEIYTTINQPLARGELITSVDSYIANNGVNNCNYSGNVDWVYNNGVSYITDSAISLTQQSKSGDWENINGNSPSIAHQDMVLEIGISHGVKPRKGSYEYMVLVNTTADATANYANSPMISTIANDKYKQVVYHSGDEIMQAVFYKKGSVTLPNGDVVEVNKGCTMIYQVNADGSYSIYLSNPNQKATTFEVSVNGVEHKLKTSKDFGGGATVEYHS